MRFGLSTHLFHNERLTEAHLASVKKHGFDRIEIFATKSHVDYTSEKQTQQLAYWIANTGLSVHSVHAPITDMLKNGEWGQVWSNASTDSARRQHALAESTAAIAFAAAVRARYVVVHLGVPDVMKTPAPDNDPGALSRSLSDLAAAARSVGITLALEVIPNRLSTPDALVERLEASDDDGAEILGHGVCLDVGHAHLMTGAVDAVETLGGHIVTTHIHDNDRKKDDHRLPFAGTINWSALVMAMQKVGYDGVWMLEVGAPEGNGDFEETLTRAESACRRLERLIEPIEFTLS